MWDARNRLEEIRDELTNDEQRWLGVLVDSLSENHRERIFRIDFNKLTSDEAIEFLEQSLLLVLVAKTKPMKKGALALQVTFPMHGEDIPEDVFDLMLEVTEKSAIFDRLLFQHQSELSESLGHLQHDIDASSRQKMIQFLSAAKKNDRAIKGLLCHSPNVVNNEVLKEASYFPRGFGTHCLRTKEDSKELCKTMDFLSNRLDLWFGLRFTFSAKTASDTSEIDSILQPIFSRLPTLEDIETLLLVFGKQSCSTKTIEVLSTKLASSLPSKRLKNLLFFFEDTISVDAENALATALRGNKKVLKMSVLDWTTGNEDYSKVTNDFRDFLKFLNNRNRIFSAISDPSFPCEKIVTMIASPNFDTMALRLLEKDPQKCDNAADLAERLRSQHQATIPTIHGGLDPLFPCHDTSIAFEILRLKAGEMFRHALPLMLENVGGRDVPSFACSAGLSQRLVTTGMAGPPRLVCDLNLLGKRRFSDVESDDDGDTNSKVPLQKKRRREKSCLEEDLGTVQEDRAISDSVSSGFASDGERPAKTQKNASSDDTTNPSMVAALDQPRVEGTILSHLFIVGAPHLN